MADEASEPTLEPGVLAVEAYHEELAMQRRKNLTIVGAVLCAVGGAAIMFAVLYFGTDLFRPKPLQTSILNPPIGNQKPSQGIYAPDKEALGVGRQALGGTYSPDTVGPKPDPNTQHPAPNAPQTGPPNSPQTTPKNMPPFNPFAGGGVPEGWGEKGPIKGHVAVNPEGVQDPENPKPQTQNPKSNEAAGSLITGRSRGGDPEGEAKDIAAALQSLGGSVRIANHFSLAGSVTGVQIVATFPASALSQARSKLAAQGVQLDVSESAPAQRSARVAGVLNSRISELRKSRAALEEKYLSDAQEIVQIDEEIQSLTSALATARAAGKSEKLTLALIAVGSL